MNLTNSYENRPFKRPKLLINDKTLKNQNSANKTTFLPSTNNTARNAINAPFIKPISQPIPSPIHIATTTLSAKKYCALIYRKPSSKKHKAWDGDAYGIFNTSTNLLTIYDTSGVYLSKKIINYQNFSDDEYIFPSNGLEFALDHFLQANSKEYEEVLNVLNENNNKSANNTHVIVNQIDKPLNAIPKLKLKPFKPPLKKNSTKILFPVQKGDSNVINDTQEPKYASLFDPSNIENPLIMNKPKNAEVDVIVDPKLSNMLRPHQREGVRFMYDCLMGIKSPDISSCLLADEMGLGKTLMTITLIWTLLKQTPFPSSKKCSQRNLSLEGHLKKVLIVCPVTLIMNWKKEFRKWLNLNRIGVLTLSTKNSPERDKNDVRNFLRVQRTYQVLIIGYEKLINVAKYLHDNDGEIGLLVCDEGHRLKNGNSKVLKALQSIDIPNKILLSGTPIQNDLDEFFTIVDFLNPSILGTYQQFKKNFIIPINKARDMNNQFNKDIIDLGQERSKEFVEITSKFILRRTNDILKKYLPSKTEYILFCKPTSRQIELFNEILVMGNFQFDKLNFNSSLGLITLFKKICNCPTLINNDNYYDSNFDKQKNKNNTFINKHNAHGPNSGKLIVLMSLLAEVRQNTDDKVVIVSNYTQTLDIIQNLLISNNMSFSRLDGSIANKQRIVLVNNFNRMSSEENFAFLLSAKSGGVGLNLVGANRLILFDNDWNPAIDLQAMGRIHRDGQKKECFIYRLITTGCIDEKIFQRQLMKINLSKKILEINAGGNEKTVPVDGGEESETASDDYEEENSNIFFDHDLKDLFTIRTDTKSNTHDLVCSCSGDGSVVVDTAKNEKHRIKNAIEGSDSIVNGWVNALQLKEQIENQNKELELKKQKIMEKCLYGYKHIDPQINKKKLYDSMLRKSINEQVSFLLEKNDI
ncbi:related to DNA repair and recombination protein RDH54 [Saccharomycodes ludwigii]|uniref:DNA repair and recombination protein RDH54 n=1 Tax=Saccharomycodes ludwigii TaxID=36035 RepID=A0A376B374_9ASCO|nr:hypothetical protein SCDLUD_003718 [Saccharomycodes ludwigii]KAH3900716.1 hypothetical protein SCDLUD_003718 [Saccharomycodes ludwigii]SSD58580.1 related to DNA repair and recombination protein RDH54 [Saccharomycodes ludwigii]